jgi:tetratricopeptide (TPR) repeat protein
MSEATADDPWQEAADWCARGVAESRLKQFDAALASFQQAALLAPELPVVWNNVGETLVGLQRFDEALAAFDKALLLDATFAPSWFGKARLHFNLHQAEEALMAAKKCLEVAAKDDPLVGPTQMILAFCENADATPQTGPP